ncbi:segregation/condensation protein A [Lederbergia sp. NSJ-179]|uniref:segregation/condensation protein A n=1 Tax=Lederbergia sp. NSJ-179 TaxID=2931402 RepID=UPI001FD3C603|nr:segregation/condensation protein A [Lederbergia sp. NSJ-179]MCJ7839415.1 segregation/condensation protein A [Lederbergia sp. NSJ-179]
MEYQVKLDTFEGPLDLLLHLINRLEIDIYDIPMAEITEQYLAYVHAMQELQLDDASEYLVMAATMLSIKSNMLLPHHDQPEEDYIYEEDDPRDELVEQLIEYKKFKEASLALKDKEADRSRMYTKPPCDLSVYAEEIGTEPVLGEVTLSDMLGAYHKLLRRKKLQKPLQTKISHQEISIEDRMTEVLQQLSEQSKRVNFHQFFPYEDKQHMVITFLAMLELMKRNEIIVEQNRMFGEIFLTLRKEPVAIGGR